MIRSYSSPLRPKEEIRSHVSALRSTFTVPVQLTSEARCFGAIGGVVGITLANPYSGVGSRG